MQAIIGNYLFAVGALDLVIEKGASAIAPGGTAIYTGIGPNVVINRGTISGETAYDATWKGGVANDDFTNAGSIVGNVLLGAGINRFTLEKGGTITGGTVTAAGTQDTFALGGAADGSFDVAQLGTVYVGFDAFEKTGASRWTVTGTNAFAGPTHVQAGELRVDGSFAASPFSVAAGATLSGSGTVGDLEALPGAVVAPGSKSIGTLSVNGELTLQPGSIFQVRTNAAGQADRLDATGKATITGSKVQVLAEKGSYRPSTTYTILSAAGGVTGRFATTTSNLAFLTPRLRYDANTVTLTLKRKTELQPATPKPVAFNSVAVTSNQHGVADAVEALGPGNRLFDAVIGQSAAGARQAFDALSGEAHASSHATAFHGAGLVQTTVLSRLRNAPAPTFTQVQGTYAAAYAADVAGAVAAEPVTLTLPSLDPRRFALWGQGFGTWGSVDASANVAGLDSSTGGFILGAEARLDQTWTLGLAGGFTRTTFEADARLSSGTTDTFFASVYGAAVWGSVNLRLGASYAWHDIDTKRAIRFPGFADEVSASYGGSTIQAFGEVGYALDLGHVTLEPFVGTSVLRLHTDGFQEEGGAAALTGYAQDQDLATTTLGLRVAARLSDELPLSVRGMLGWRHAYGDVNPTALLAFAGGASSFAVAGTPVDRDALVAEAGLDWQASRDISLGVSYEGQIGEQAQEHTVKGSFIWRFGTR